MFGLSLSPAWGAVVAVLIVGGFLFLTHLVNIRVG